VTETPNDLRDAIRTALATTPAKHTQGHARPWDTHGTEHRYDATCALCRGEDDTLTDAVVTVVAEHLADARRLAARIHGIAKHPSFTAPADLAQALHEHATQLLDALGTGDRRDGAESSPTPPQTPAATREPPKRLRGSQRPAGGFSAFPKFPVHCGRLAEVEACKRPGEPFTVAMDPGDPAIDCTQCRIRLASDVLKPEEWCERYGCTVLDPDGWRRPDAPDWNERITLGVFHRLLAGSTTNAAATGAYERITVDLALLRTAEREAGSEP
jgi:hypothetical protein